MKLITFRLTDGVPRLGAWLEDGVRAVDLARAALARDGDATPVLTSMQALMDAGEAGLDLARKTSDWAANTGDEDLVVPANNGFSLMSPVPVPAQIRDGLFFEDHLKQAFAVLRRTRARAEPDPEEALRRFEKAGLFGIPEVWYKRPIYYKANRFSVIGSDTDIIWPYYAENLDYELEFGCFIGKRVRDVSRKDAASHIFGYSIFNDISARDVQSEEMPGQLGPTKSKDFDTGNIIGPCVVTADEIGDPYNLTMIARVNGEEWSRGNSGSAYWRFEDAIEIMSRSETLYPGEFIGSGTVGGGCGLEMERSLSPGDVIELEVEGIGILRNRIVRLDS